MRLLSLLAAAAFTQQVLATNSTLPEQLFLDLRIQDVFDNTTGMNHVEPWATKYIESLRAQRYGDAIWARYHISGDVEDGIVDGSSNMTVLEVIADDAREYRVNEPELYTEALSFYTQTSSEDSHATDVLALLQRIGEEDVTELEKRKTYGISCSKDWLAYEYSCANLLSLMSESKTYIGNTRSVYSYGNCRLRVGPYKGTSTDLTEWTAHAVAKLILEECEYVPACCDYKVVSGYSPKNSGHRKVCLSRKNSGCS
ncbi:hypothetical protein P175DRAFT_0497885 [Aspergillus ochraceoroseus IBT 24754]|uniref:WD-like domain-containing protein n=3 Tax=Aspergillus subgen. Nidulantes TaxID=2720870 RepID=A0A0F8XPF3_9EURO|nr:uncharacterized protein P175DRAFT_0497885 [Aspergillus ochraceoroseus IBT 24754]KKK21244.1 hypothetical protein AOCH_005116 [Aspergillus ochraceoroseus]KKK25387.1 hypothetical protein ARAM_005485 [Aspergillus rambellii]PTU24782.1 hypothetical protein P175DRAFT_0497885 [Aspergillus ochraceoroseus IBT 24754]